MTLEKRLTEIESRREEVAELTEKGLVRKAIVELQDYEFLVSQSKLLAAEQEEVLQLLQEVKELERQISLHANHKLTLQRILRIVDFFDIFDYHPRVVKLAEDSLAKEKEIEEHSDI